MKIDVDYTEEEIVAIEFALGAMIEKLDIMFECNEVPIAENELKFYKAIDSAFHKTTEWKRQQHD